MSISSPDEHDPDEHNSDKRAGEPRPSKPDRSVVQIVTTTATIEAARAIAQVLLTERLVACVQIDGPVESHYCWQGKQEQSSEFRLTIKTADPCKYLVLHAIQKLHSYDVPEVLVTSVSLASDSYLDWVYQQTSPSMISFAIYLYGPQWGPVGITFEQVANRISTFERMHFEWDGSFVWTGEEDGAKWQIDGMLYDAGGELQYIDIKGRCPKSKWDQLVRAGICGDNLPPSQLTVLVLPGQTRKTLEQFHQETWILSE